MAHLCFLSVANELMANQAAGFGDVKLVNVFVSDVGLYDTLSKLRLQGPMEP
jgi:hypothetical protein